MKQILKKLYLYIIHKFMKYKSNKDTNIIEFKHIKEITESEWNYLLTNNLINSDTQYNVKLDKTETTSYSYII